MEGSRSKKILEMIAKQNQLINNNETDERTYTNLLELALENEFIYQDDTTPTVEQEIVLENVSLSNDHDDNLLMMEQEIVLQNYVSAPNNAAKQGEVADAVIYSNLYKNPDHIQASTSKIIPTEETDVDQVLKKMDVVENESETEDAYNEESSKSEGEEDNKEWETIQKRRKKLSKRMEMRQLKNAGKNYKTSKGKLIGAKKMLNNPCKEGMCMNKCYLISENNRTELFSFFLKTGRQCATKEIP